MTLKSSASPISSYLDASDIDSSFPYTILDDVTTSTAEGNSPSSQSPSPSRRRARDLQHILHTIEKAAYTAGQTVALVTAGQIDIKATKANTRDLVTESDVKCQRVIREIIRDEFPMDLFLGEEDEEEGGDVSSCDGGDAAGALQALLRGIRSSPPPPSHSTSSSITEATQRRRQVGDNDCGDGEEKNRTNDKQDEDGLEREKGEDRLLFIVDPIDGTTNFQAGLPIYAMSIGVVSLPSSSSSSPEVIAGVIYNPSLGEMTSAVKGRGCYVNNRRLNTNTSTQQQQQQQPARTSILDQSLINIGFPVCKESTLQASSKAVSALSTKVRGLRMVACASQTMAWVAQSKFNAYVGWDLNFWDIAAGLVIVTESGGLVSKFDGSTANVTSRDMIITCPPERVGEEGLLRDELIMVLRENDCLEY